MVPEHVKQAAEASLVPGAFFAPEPRAIRFSFVPSLCWRWEIISGRLLDPALTRNEAEFAAWHVHQADDAGEFQPRLSILYQAEENRLYVVRHIQVYGHEAYESAPHVIETRAVRKWTRELAGWVDVARGDAAISEDQIAAGCRRLLFQAVCGASRLPVASHESQLPAFAVGELGYWPSLAAAISANRAEQRNLPDIPLRQPEQLLKLALRPELPRLERAKLLEAALRATPTDRVVALAELWHEPGQAHANGESNLVSVVTRLFNHLGLTPYIPIETRLALFLNRLMQHHEAQAEDSAQRSELIDLVALLLLQLARHLAAFDLRLFHNFGADYPDLLLLDALLRVYDSWLERLPEMVFPSAVNPPQASSAGCEDRQQAQRRLAWLLASLLRKEHEGLRVPEAPTSPGENQRVLPAPLIHVDDAEIMEPRLRSKRLFADDAWEVPRSEGHKELLAAAAGDLQTAAGQRLLGEALFLDRPLGALRAPDMVDDTPLLSYVAFSRSLAQARLRKMHQFHWLDKDTFQNLKAAIADLPIGGIAASELPGQPRLGVVSLEDARLNLPDFVFLRTTRSSLQALLASGQLPLESLDEETRAWLTTARNVLLIRTAAPPGKIRLTAFDRQQKARAKWTFSPT